MRAAASGICSSGGEYRLLSPPPKAALGDYHVLPEECLFKPGREDILESVQQVLESELTCGIMVVDKTT